MRFTVRKIQDSDVVGFRSALSSVAAEKKFLLTIKAPSAQEISNFVLNNISNNHAQYVAIVDEAIVGWSDVVPYQKELIKHAGLLGMGVIAAYRGNGIGKALLAQTINHCRESGLKRIELEVFSNNSTAISLYRKFGFEHEGTKRSARCIDDTYLDVNFMGLLLK